MAVSTIDPNGLNIGQIGGRRNLLINSDFSVAQRSTSKTGVASSAYHTVDRWNYADDSTGVLTMSQDTNAPDGFGYSFKSLVTTADTSIGTTAQVRVEQRIESSSVQHLKYGTSNAEQVTVSFWVKTNKTGNWSVGLYMEGSGANISQAYTVNSADTWEYKQVTFAGNVTNSMSGNLRLWFTFAAGIDRTDGTSNTWSTDTGHRAVGQAVNLFDATNNYWQITGVQLELGDVATPFEHRSYGEELSACMRFYQQWNEVEVMGAGIWYTANQVLGHLPFKQTMRAAPTITVSATNFCKVYKTSATIQSNDSSSPFDIINLSNARINLGMASNGTAGQGALIQTETGAAFYVDAEL